MKKISAIIVLAAIAAFVVVGCKKSEAPQAPQSAPTSTASAPTSTVSAPTATAPAAAPAAHK